MTIFRALLLSVLTAGAALPCGAGQTSVEQQSGDDLYAAGASIQVARPVSGDAVLAGGTVLVTGSVAEDVLAAGGSLTVTGDIDDDIRAAGGSLTLIGAVGGDAILAGGAVTLAVPSAVAGNAWVAGGVLRLSGNIEGDLRAAGGEVVIAGRVNGDADVYAESLEVHPGAVIRGTLHYRGPKPAIIAADAEIGESVYTESRGLDGPGASLVGGLLGALVFFISLAVCALIFAWLLPDACREAASNARRRMLLSLGTGVLGVIAIPVIAVVLFALVVTIPLAVALVAGYVVVLVLGVLTTLACLGGWIRERFPAGRGEGAGAHILSVLIGALALWLVALVPFVGAVIVLLAFVTGVGGLILLAARLYKKP